MESLAPSITALMSRERVARAVATSVVYAAVRHHEVGLVAVAERARRHMRRIASALALRSAAPPCAHAGAGSALDVLPQLVPNAVDGWAVPDG